MASVKDYIEGMKEDSMQAYSDPSREADPHALPDVEVFQAGPDGSLVTLEDGTTYQSGEWFWWACFPGCLPDGDPVGPFSTETEALADAQGALLDCFGVAGAQ